MAAQAYTNFSPNGGAANQPTSFVAADGFVGPPTSPLNVNNPTFATASFPGGIAGGTVIHGAPTTLVTPVQAVSATATPFTLAVPAGATVTANQFYTVTAFTGTTVSAEIGSASGDASYVAATSVKNGGVVTLAPVASTAAAAALLNTTSGGLVFTLAQGTPTATGSGNLVTTYVIP
jgi:hypothetical protein